MTATAGRRPVPPRPGRHARPNRTPDDIAAMIRVDHAGETAAVRIYRGQLAVLGAGPATARAAELVRHMKAQEDVHLETFERLVAERGVRPTALAPIWDAASYTLGAVTALMGEKAAMACTEAVEEVIDGHYARQQAQLAGRDGELEEVVVTAQFREERLQDTPIAISAMSAEALESRSAGDIAQAAAAAPNVALSKGAGGFGQTAAIFIRGVGQNDPHFAVEPGVGMYIDDVYYGVMTGSVFSLLDTDRVEVLRGPQGTLAGKNSIGGSVKLFSKKPTAETDGYAEVTLGGRRFVGLRAAGNITLVPDKLFLRISGASRRVNGYVDRLDYNCVTHSPNVDTYHANPDCKLGTQGGEDIFTGRATLRWIVNESVEDLLSFDSTQDSSENPASKQIFQSPLWAGTENFITPPHSYTNYDNNISTPTGPGAGPAFERPDKTPLDAIGVTNRLHWNFADALSLDSITGWRKSTVQFSTPSEATPYTVSDQVWRLAHKQFTQELRLSGEWGKLLNWTVGGFYYDADGVSSLRVNLPGGLAVGGGGLNLDLFARDPVKTKSKSAFAHSVWHLGDRLNLTAAVRYTNDSKSYTFNRWDRFGNPHPALIGLQDLTRSYSGSRTDYRAGIDYKWTDQLMTYAQVSTGYKGGGVSPRPYFVSQAVPYQPETLTAYEAGLKLQGFERRLTVNAAVFLNKYKDFQGLIFSCPAYTPGNAPAPCAMTANIGDADIKGIELEINAEPVDGLRLDLSAGKLDFQFKRVNPVSGVQLGFKNVYTPDFNLAAGAQYDFSLGAHGTLTPRLDYSYHSDFYTSIINTDPVNKIDAQGLVNARITWKGPGDDWEAALTVTNLADAFYYVSKNASSTAPYFDGTGRPGEPRQWLVSVKRRF